MTLRPATPARRPLGRPALDVPRRHAVTIRLTDPEFAALVSRAQALGCSVTKAAERFVVAAGTTTNPAIIAHRATLGAR